MLKTWPRRPSWVPFWSARLASGQKPHGTQLNAKVCGVNGFCWPGWIWSYEDAEWSCRNPPIEEVYQTFCPFPWFHIHQNLSQSEGVRDLLGASQTMKDWYHFLWWGSSDMGPCWVSLLQSPVRSSHGTTLAHVVQLEIHFRKCLQVGR